MSCSIPGSTPNEWQFLASARHAIRWSLLGVCLSACGAAEPSKTEPPQAEPSALRSAALTAAQPTLEEDFAYPNAAQIAAEHGVTLSRGDGHVLFADCNAGTDLIEIWSTLKDLQCFSLRGERGWLQLNVPDVYLIKATSRALRATVEVSGQTQTLSVPVNTWVPAGTAVDGVPAALVSLETVN